MAYLETGVDKLVALVAKQKRIELSQAAKELKVDTAVVQEWGEFLEEEGIVSLEYSLSKTFIVEKRMSKAEIVRKEKEYEGGKEAFVRRVDVALKHLDDDTAGFEDIKRQYDDLKHHLGHDMDAVKEEMEQLKQYEELKKSLDADIEKQRGEYRASLEGVRAKVAEQEAKYKKALSDIGTEAERIGKEMEGLKGLRKEEQDLMRRIGDLSAAAAKVKERLDAQGTAIAEHEGRLTTLRELAERLRLDIVQKRKREIEPMLRISDDQSARILRIQDEIMGKVKARSEKMREFEKQSEEVVARFAGFFDRRARTEQLIKDLDKAKEEMRADLEDLVRRAKAFQVSRGADTDTHLKDLEKKFAQFDERRGAFSSGLSRLKGLLMGKGDAGADAKGARAAAAPRKAAGKARAAPKRGAAKRPAGKAAPKRKK